MSHHGSCFFAFSVTADGHEHGLRSSLEVLVTGCPRAARVKRVPLRPFLSPPSCPLVVVTKPPDRIPHGAVLVDQYLLGQPDPNRCEHEPAAVKVAQFQILGLLNRLGMLAQSCSQITSLAHIDRSIGETCVRVESATVVDCIDAPANGNFRGQSYRWITHKRSRRISAKLIDCEWIIRPHGSTLTTTALATNDPETVPFPSMVSTLPFR